MLNIASKTLSSYGHALPSNTFQVVNGNDDMVCAYVITMALTSGLTISYSNDAALRALMRRVREFPSIKVTIFSGHLMHDVPYQSAFNNCEVLEGIPGLVEPSMTFEEFKGMSDQGVDSLPSEDVVDAAHLDSTSVVVEDDSDDDL